MTIVLSKYKDSRGCKVTRIKLVGNKCEEKEGM